MSSIEQEPTSGNTSVLQWLGKIKIDRVIAIGSAFSVAVGASFLHGYWSYYLDTEWLSFVSVYDFFIASIVPVVATIGAYFLHTAILIFIFLLIDSGNKGLKRDYPDYNEQVEGEKIKDRAIDLYLWVMLTLTAVLGGVVNGIWMPFFIGLSIYLTGVVLFSTKLDSKVKGASSSVTIVVLFILAAYQHGRSAAVDRVDDPPFWAQSEDLSKEGKSIFVGNLGDYRFFYEIGDGKEALVVATERAAELYKLSRVLKPL